MDESIVKFINENVYLIAIAVFIVIILLVSLKKKYNTLKWRKNRLKTAGDDFEKEAFKELKSSPEIKKAFQGVYLHNGRAIKQIDLIGISNKAIYVVECKDYHGLVSVFNQREWVHLLPSNETERFYSPVLQNEGHIKFLLDLGKNTLQNVPIINIVVFSNKTSVDFKNKISTAAICNLRNLKKIISHYDNMLPTNINVNKISNFLKPFTNVSLDIKEMQLSQARISEYVRSQKEDY